MNFKCAFLLFLAIEIFLTFESDAFRVSNYLRDLQITSNPDTYLTPPKIIRRNGYPAETHIIQSADGYLLEMHRIPYGKAGLQLKKPYPVLLHHGLLCSSLDWIIAGPEKSLGYRLADAGYDVWMPNARGNTFSRSHISMNPKQKEFWNFSFHEQGYYDVPANIDYILNRTASEHLGYIGHSQGTTSFFVMASTRPEYNSKIKFQISLAPVGAIPHTTSAFRYMVPYAKQIFDMSDWYNKGAFLERDLMTSIITKMFCGKALFSYDVCEQLIIFSLFGKDPQQFNSSLLPIISANIPAGTSGKNMMHCAQLISTGKFQLYDYGLAENIKRYHSATPPAYNLSEITAPVLFYYGPNDILADPLDVKLLYQKIPNPMGLRSVKFDKFNHIDFLFAKDLNRLLNDELIQFVRNATSFWDGEEFLENTVSEAREARAKCPPPVDVPFDSSSFINKIPIPGLAGIDGNLPNLSDAQEYPDMIKNKVAEGIETVKRDITVAVNKANEQINGAVIENIQKGGAMVRAGIDDTAARVSHKIKENVFVAKTTLEKSTIEFEQKIKEAMEKLENIFTAKF